MIVAVMPAMDRAALIAAVERLPFEPVIVEVRLDLAEDPSPEGLTDLPFEWIATCRRVQDGGAWAGEEDARRALLETALRAGARWIDVEADVHETWDGVPADRLLVSIHDLDGTPSHVEEFVRRAAVQGVQRIKVATRVHDLTDVLRLKRLAGVAEGRVAAIGIGPAGIITRVLPRRMGSVWTYVWAGAPDAHPDDLGILGVEDCEQLYGRAIERGDSPIVYGVLADRAEASIGPWVYNRVFRQRELPPVYLPISSRNLVGLRETIRTFGIRGLSVTRPFKRDVLLVVDRCHELARLIGAANTIVVEDGGLTAYNTDYRGVLEPVREALDGTGHMEPALVVGAGGAGRAAALALSHLGLEVTIHARKPEQAAESALEVGVKSGPLPDEPPRVLVNCTPVGVGDLAGELPVPESLLAGEGQVVMETNYQPIETELLRQARSRGARVVTGGDMYATQARHQMHLFWAGLGRVDHEVDEATQWALTQRGYA